MVERKKDVFEFVFSIMGVHCDTMMHTNGFTNKNVHNGRVRLNTFRGVATKIAAAKEQEELKP